VCLKKRSIEGGGFIEEVSKGRRVSADEWLNRYKDMQDVGRRVEFN